MLDKPSKEEDEYFAREDIEKKRKLAFQQAQVMAEQQREALKKLHHMKCPKCGLDLHPLKRGGVNLETCFNCQGVWMDAGDLEHLAEEIKHPPPRQPLVDAILNLFKND
jgi:uncharacterized protein